MREEAAGKGQRIPGMGKAEGRKGRQFPAGVTWGGSMEEAAFEPTLKGEEGLNEWT